MRPTSSHPPGVDSRLRRHSKGPEAQLADLDRLATLTPARMGAYPATSGCQIRYRRCRISAPPCRKAALYACLLAHEDWKDTSRLLSHNDDDCRGPLGRGMALWSTGWRDSCRSCRKTLGASS